MKKLDEFLKNANSLIHIESKRIINILERNHFEINNKEEAELFISMTIESVGNKIGMSELLQKRSDMTRETIEIIISDSLHVSFQIFMAINNHPIDRKKLGMNKYGAMTMMHEILYVKEILNVIESLTNLK